MGFIKYFFLLPFIIIYSCSENFTGANQNSSCVDNMSFECARPLNLNQINYDTIKSNNNVNYYIFNTSKNGVIEVHISDVPQELNLNLQLYRQGSPSIIKEYLIAGQGENFVDMVIQTFGTFYAKVYDRSLNASAVNNPYKIMVKLDTSDIYEYNNSFENSSLVLLDSIIYAKIKPVFDIDIFKFYLNDLGLSKIYFLNVPSNLKLKLELYSYAYFNPIYTYTAINQGEPFEIFYNVSYTGNYSLRIWELTNSQWNDSLYTFRISLDTFK